MLFDGVSHQLPDMDPVETEEWLDSFDSVLDAKGRNRARFLLMRLLERARACQVDFPSMVSTPYVNTIPKDQEPWFPGDEDMERLIRRYVRWNAAAMVVRANTRHEGLGGHLSTYASSASLYEVGFNHFFRGRSGGDVGDQVFFQGHAAPGIYARAFVEGRLTEEQLDRFRCEVGGGGLPSYPHPRLMPGFWEFPTVSMGLGPLFAVHQAHINRYLLHRHLVDTSRSRVWAFVGDGEMDEPESIAALGLAGREHLANLTFVVNCNLQRLDGPVRGNGKIIQELEALFKGAGWNVIKVIWGTRWDDLLARDVDGVLLDKMNSTPDGDFQNYTTQSGAYIREHFFGPDPRLRKLVENLSDADLQALPRGGHDYRKLYAAYRLATEEINQPTAILAKTVKGWTLGPAIEARNATHQIKKMTRDQLIAFRNRIHLESEIADEDLDSDLPPYIRPAPGSPLYDYLMSRIAARSGSVPQRTVQPVAAREPSASPFDDLMNGSGNQAVSTTMAFSRLLRNLVKDPAAGPLVVPVVPDEARTFGLEPLISAVSIYSPAGQRYTPVDAGLALSYAESQSGQILEEGITESGAAASFAALATAYATWARPMLPVYLFYSMFGFQRFGDLAWLLGDVRARGVLAGCTAGRTTLQGEGLQHADGHSPLLASVNPACRVYDPAFSYELAVIMREAAAKILGGGVEDRFFYITLYNENYPMPSINEIPALAALGPAEARQERNAVEDGIVKGMYRFAPVPISTGGNGLRSGSGSGSSIGRSLTLLFSGPLWQEVAKAREMLAEGWGVASDLFSVTSYTSLRTDALSCERHNMLRPDEPRAQPHLETQLRSGSGPVIAVTDYIRAVPDQIARFVSRPFVSLGTDGFGRSDTREALRSFFEVDAAHIVIAALAALSAEGKGSPKEVAEAVSSLGVRADLPDPWTA